MRHAIALLLVVLGCASLLTSSLPARSADPPVPACIQYWPEARYRALGYDHVVHIRSHCANDARCEVTTDVNPETLETTVPARGEVELVTWVGSPARKFTPQVRCHLVR